jgi:hypothetical protein
MSNLSEEFYNAFRNLYDEYILVKKATILLENLDPKHKIHIAPLNQLRSGFDHAFKASVVDEKQFQHEIIEMQSHVRRAGYDAFELLSSILAQSVIGKIKWVSNKALEIVFPEYYTSISPQLTNLQVKLAEIRTDKDHFNNPFNQYLTEIVSLIEIYKKVSSMIPALKEYDRKQLLSKIITYGLTLISGIVIGIIVAKFK